MNLVIFDDNKRENFYPLTLTRSTGDLRVGVLKLRQRIATFFEKEKYSMIIHSDLCKLYKERFDKKQINEIESGETIFVNSRLKINDKFVELIKEMDLGNKIEICGVLVCAKINASKMEISSEDLISNFLDCKNIHTEMEFHFWEYTWDFIKENSKYINEDFHNFFYDKDNYFDLETGVTVLHPYNIWIGEGVKIKPGVVIDASEGPVIIDEEVKIMANAVIIGPCYIGKKSIIKVGAKIYEGTSIGPVCKVGGEVEDTIIHGYSNKQHDGFLGHSYLGEWVNLGADTNNSDLKNNYKNVSVYFYPKNEKIDSGSLFVGTIIGDHSKTGINCSINTGTIIGIGCNLWGSSLIKDYIPSFSWGETGKISEYKINKFLETADHVKARRKKSISSIEKELYKKIRDFELV